MHPWAHDAIFYHIYPLGLTGAPAANDGHSAPEPRLNRLRDWAPHIRGLGANAVYLGPVFESVSHGYDTTDYCHVDRRLGTHETLRALVEHFHAHGIRVVLDAVFNHVGREFPAFRDLRERGEHSPYRDWFAGVDFSRRNGYGDPFTYEAWAGHDTLVKLNLRHPDVREMLFAVVRQWFAEFQIDGLRFDAADVMDRDCLRDLAGVCRDVCPDSFLFGEMVHGNYRELTDAGALDSATNYEAFKGLYSSFNDGNLFEIAHSLNRQFGPGGLYRDLPLYAFADNHDVNRVASLLTNPAHLYPLYGLLFTMPGVPSIYYGSEWGIPGEKRHGDDGPLRPALRWPVPPESMPRPDLMGAIRRFASVRASVPALRHGGYEQLHVAPRQLAFTRTHEQGPAIVAVNAADEPISLDLPVPLADGTRLTDALDPAFSATVADGRTSLDHVPPTWLRILVPAA